jgi:sulfate permease, SulP family
VAVRNLQAELAALGLAHLPADVQVYEITGPMFFGAIENIRRPFLEIRPYPRVLIIRLYRVPFIDITGIQTLAETVSQLRKKGVSVMLCEANERVRAKLTRAGLATGTNDDTWDQSLKDCLSRAHLIERPQPLEVA